ncbi:MAG: RdgB/HAM1 family non-canonical purine NTP pyrophosphatase [Chlamydiae bacterium]|nr:RdgB/HAM1 family non-canonical purine NTP pyrophosphatase [Chlamydiota bacterium]
MKLGIASSNTNKIREFKSLLSSISNLELVSMKDFPDYIPPEETGDTFEDNASIKALDFAKFINGYALADDSGLVVPALNGEPGVRSARYAKEDATDSENRAKLKIALSKIQEKDRQAYFACALALAAPQGIKKITTGFCEGYLILEERGNQGFGYDPLFIRHDYSKTFAELDEKVKNKISHRRKAFDKMLPYLENIFSN